MVKDWWNEVEAGKLLAKLGGIGGSFVAAHLVALTTMPQYVAFWNHLYLTAPTVTNQPAFEKMVGTTFSAIWLVGEHFYQRVTETPDNHIRTTDVPAPPSPAVEGG